MNCRVMGIVNVTPDSFSDGGKYLRPEEALRRVDNMIAAGASIVDLGGESTRPDASPLTGREEWQRLEPVVRTACAQAETRGVVVSVDTYHPETAERALDCGVKMINCVYGDPIPAMITLCRQYRAELVMPAACWKTHGAALSGVKAYIDPMIGFGTTRDEDLARLRSIAALTRQGDVLVGVSRKRIVKKLTGVKVLGKDLAGNLALVAWCALNGVRVVRVHDVAETVQLLRVLSAVTART